MGSFTLESEMGANAVKAAKKVLKKHDEPSMKIKALAKAVVAMLGDDVREKDVRKLVEKSDKFSVEGKLVSFTKKNKTKNDRKRKSKDENEQEGVCAGGGIESSSKKKKKTSSFDAAAWRTEHKIVLRGPENEASADKALNENPSMYPLASFDDERCRSSIAPELVRHCSVTKGFANPSPVQAQCWPILSPPSSLSSSEGGKRTGGRDVVGIAETGSGKTLAFSLPALTAMRDDDARRKGGGGGKRAPRLLVLAPTRELAMQSHEVLDEYGALVGLRSLVVYGGVPKHPQTKVLRGVGTDCLVATPGRIRDLLNDGACDLSRVAHLVLDEADRMLDMGFEEDVRDIVGRCVRPGRRTHMFSATWPPHVRKAASDYAVDPIRVYVGVDDARANGDDDDQGGGGAVSLSANERVSQTVEVIEDRARDARLRALLREHHDGRNRVLIFALYKKEAARVERSLLRDGWNCCSVHGDKGQADRTQALARFKDGSTPLMIATDVAARGLDVPDVEVVINYTFPLTIEDYVHRIGRTGRAGKRGASFTFFQPSDKGHAGELQAVMRRAGQPIPEELAKFGSTIKKKEHNLYGNFGPKGGVPMKKATRIVFD